MWSGQLLDYVRLESAEEGPMDGPAHGPFYLGSMVDDALDLLAAQAPAPTPLLQPRPLLPSSPRGV